VIQTKGRQTEAVPYLFTSFQAIFFLTLLPHYETLVNLFSTFPFGNFMVGLLAYSDAVQLVAHTAIAVNRYQVMASNVSSVRRFWLRLLNFSPDGLSAFLKELGRDLCPQRAGGFG
jgi:hypothetical protein